MSGTERRDLRLARVNLNVVIEGSGDPVVLLHGWPQTSHEWRKIVPLISHRYRVLAPDLPGLGDSSIPPDGYDKKTLAGDLVGMCAQLGLGRFHLVGHEWGADDTLVSRRATA